MTLIEYRVTDFETVVDDLYRDIHKGIRTELFAITTAAGSIDPANPIDRAALADHIVSVSAVLESHAHHEDAVIDPVLDYDHKSGKANVTSADAILAKARPGDAITIRGEAAPQP